MNKYNEILSGMESKKNLSEELSEVAYEVRKIKKRRRRMGTVCAAAAVVLSVTVTSAAAAYNWDIRAITAAWFGGRTENIAENILEITAENVTNSFENLVIEPKGAVYDENLAIVFMEIARTDGEIFDCLPYEALTTDGEPYPNGSLDTKSPQYRFGTYDMYVPAGENSWYAKRFFSRYFIVGDDDPADERITAAFCMDSRSLSSEHSKLHIEFGNLREDKFTFKPMGTMGTMLNAYTVETINGFWSGDIDFDEVHPCAQRKIAPNSSTEMRVYYQNGNSTEHEFTVTELSVSQISVNAKMESDNPEEMMFLVEFEVGEVIMRDGSVHPICPDFSVPSFIAEYGNLTGLDVPQQDKWEINATFMLQESINPDDAVQIKLGNTVFDME